MQLRAGVERLQASSQPLCGGNLMESDTNLSGGLEVDLVPPTHAISHSFLGSFHKHRVPTVCLALSQVLRYTQ